MTKKEKNELKALLKNDNTSEDEILEWCLERGGYVETIAELLGI